MGSKDTKFDFAVWLGECCMGIICGFLNSKSSSDEEASAQLNEVSDTGRANLKHYLEDTIKRLDREKGSMSNDVLKVNIEPSVCKSLHRLTQGAPANFRGQVQEILRKHRVLPDHQADMHDFRVALEACLNLIGDIPDGPAETGGVEPTEQELKSLNACLSRLWQIDANRRLPYQKGYRLNHGSRVAFDSSSDYAKDPLFSFVDKKKLMSNSCTRAFLALLDNYQADNDVEEHVTAQEKSEMDAFIHELMRTPHMQYVHKVLRKWVPDNVSPDYRKFGAQVFEIWFTVYGMGRGPKSSSGFEHTFVGEVDVAKGALTGMHNWIQFWNQEQRGNINYKGHCGKVTDEDHRLVSVRFGFDGEDKDVSTFLVGTSVAFDLAMYTLAFLGYGGECDQDNIYFGDFVGPMRLCTYSWDVYGHKVVRSAFLR